MNTLLNIIDNEQIKDCEVNLHAVTHCNKGGWHLDEILCMLMHAKKLGVESYNIVLTRDNSFIEKAKEMDDVLVYDVGMGELDHHQPDAKKRHDGVKHASASLVAEHLKIELGNSFLRLIEENDFIDNGVAIEQPDFEIIFDLIKKANSHYEEVSYDANLNMTKVFDLLKVLDFSENEIANTVISLRNNDSYKEYISSRNNEYQESLSRINSSIKEAKSIENTLIFDKYFPAIELVDTGIETVIFLGGNGQWAVQGVPKSTKEWNIPLKSFPTEFAGLRNEELVEKSGMQGGIFCLPFIAFFDTKENALKAISKMH